MGYFTKDSSSATCKHVHRLKTAYPRLDFVESGSRYYNSAIGRWANRDPIGERGGLLLYGFVGNDPTSKSDYLGWQVNETVCPPKIHSAKPMKGWKYDCSPYWRKATSEEWNTLSDLMPPIIGTAVFVITQVYVRDCKQLTWVLKRWDHYYWDKRTCKCEYLVSRFETTDQVIVNTLQWRWVSPLNLQPVTPSPLIGAL